MNQVLLLHYRAVVNQVLLLPLEDWLVNRVHLLLLEDRLVNQVLLLLPDDWLVVNQVQLLQYRAVVNQILLLLLEDWPVVNPQVLRLLLEDQLMVVKLLLLVDLLLNYVCGKHLHLLGLHVLLLFFHDNLL